MDVDLLHRIYHLDGIDLPSNQSRECCLKLYDLFTSFAKGMVESESGDLRGSSSTHYKNLRDFLQPTKESSQASHIEWFPGYGCALILHKDKIQRHNSLNVTVLGLDSHDHVVHSSGKNQYEFSSIAQTYVELYVGEIVLTKKIGFLRSFQSLFNEASRHNGDERSAADGRQGHQKTPAFIHALLLQALKCRCSSKECTCEDVLPRGGFTDVGQHTGGKARDTAFALVRHVCLWTMNHSFNQDDEVLFNELSHDAVMLYFHSFVLEVAIQAVKESIRNESSNLLLKSISHLWSIMRVICTIAAPLSDEGHDLSAHFSKMKLAKAVIMEIQRQWHRACVTKNTIELPRVSYRDPKLLVPPIATLQTTSQVTLAHIRLLIRENIEFIPTFCLDESWTISSAHKWAGQIKSKSASSSSTLSVYLRQIEKIFWRLSEKYLVKPLGSKDLQKVADLLDFYRESVNYSFSPNSEANYVSLLHVRLRSIELLATWLVYCIAFNSTRAVYSDVLKGYGVALHFHDLSHLVLQDEEHIVILKRVITFLRKNHFGEGKEIFSMRCPQDWKSATFEMGNLYARRYLCSTLAKEREDAKHRVTKHWQEVERKQALARILRYELIGLVSKHDRAFIECERADRLRPRRDYQYNVRCARKNLDDAESKVNLKESDITEAEKAPPSVIQPLPTSDDKANKVLFFLYMSEEFKILSRLSLVAQQLLVPRPWQAQCGGEDGMHRVDVFDQIKVKQKEISWDQHYNINQKCEYHTPREKRKGAHQWLDISMHMEVPAAKDIGPYHVDKIHTTSDGIWYPDDSNVRLVWRGGSLTHDKDKDEGEFNPFAIICSYTAAYFTERLPEYSQELQWSVYLPPNVNDDKSRGNRSYSSLYLKKDWLDKEGFLQFVSLRQFPSQVLRKLAVALKSECLPLHEESVQVLLRQAAFQIGTLSFSEKRLDFMWRLDFEEIRTTCLVLIAEVADKYVETPSFCAAFVILAELFCYFSSAFAPEDALKLGSKTNVAEVLSFAALKWALSYDNEVAHSAPECVSAIRSRQVIYFRTAALCLVHQKDLSLPEATLLLTCIVRAKNSFVDAKDDLEERENLNMLCIHFLSNNDSYRSRLVCCSEKLSEILKCIVITAPASLEWIQDDTSNYCFSADGSDSHVYAMNILTGVVLIDGMPPNTLPSSITNDERFKRVFGKNNFEVVLKGEKLETVGPIQGHLYRFRKTGDSLLIEESVQINDESDIDGCWEDSLELLDISQISTWGNELPEKLKDSYSHWISRNRHIVLFRNKDFRKRDCAYLHNMTTCERSNVFQQKNIPDGIVLDRLVIHESPVLNILARIEAKKMIHTFLLPRDSNKGHVIIFDLYRFGLTFSLEPDSRELKCLEIVGYHLAPIQHLEGIFPGLDNYLILEKSDNATFKKVIVPFGRVIKNNDSSIRISLLTKDLLPTCNNVNEEMQLFQYDIHPRFKTLEATNISARLFLVSLFAATMSNVPDSALGMTGEEHACILVRQCQVNRPFSSIETKCLDNLISLSRGKSSTLSLLCHDLRRSALEFSFLHNPSDPSSMKDYEVDEGMFSDDASAYLAMDNTVSSRLFLSPTECRRIIGRVLLQNCMKTRRRNVILLELDECPIPREVVISCNKSICKLWLEDFSQVSGDKKEFPVSHSANTNLEKAVYGELEDSWNLHCQESGININLAENSNASIQKIGMEVDLALSTLEKYIFHALTHQTPTQSNWHAQSLGYLRLINIIPTATKREIVALACDSSKVTEYNPLLSQTSIETIRQAVITWLELCVLQDKLSCLLNLGSKNKDFIKELTSQRSWDTNKHPYWLVYEAEQGIRIRPEQYEVANHLVNNNGHVIQLNMGLGKTRVILPMLILYYAYQSSCERIPRLHILSTLTSEVCEHFQSTLGVSALRGRLFTLPFRRDVELDGQKIQSILDLISYCRQERGFFVIAPEHRLSLELKVKELHLDGQYEMSESLGQVVTSCWQDVYDEVDEILHHRYQLVYSLGSVQPLPHMIYRWQAAQALLKMFRSKPCQIKGIAIVMKEKLFEAFPWITVEDNVDSEEFRRKMARSLFDQPPLEFAWLANHTKREEMCKVISEPSANPMNLESKLSPEHFNDILALRGLLAHDILLHCLKKRYRVDFGPNYSNGRKKLAVPYRGADMPSARSEFSHPDCAMLLSILVYYSSGLSKNDLKAAFAALLRKGCNFKKKTYENWLSESRKRMDETTYHAVNKIDKIDLSNNSQFDVLYEYFHKNPETVNFWLNTIIFPCYLDHYPQRLVATSWHLAFNKDNFSIGFSGTNDNHLVLPLQLKQYLPWGTEHSIWRNLLSTNGKMLDVVIARTGTCEELGNGRANELLLQFITANKNVDALIDCGALLAGISNRCVADHLSAELLPYSKSNLKGVTFYDDSTKEWVILERSGRSLPKHQSSLKEKDTFVLFDEPRCRGVDFKLRPNAIAALTLGQGMCKDKFMQAAGRMRQLHNEQSLIIVGEKRIFNEIRQQGSMVVDEEGKIQGLQQESNIYMDILMELVALGSLTRNDLDKAIKTMNEDKLVTIQGILTWVMHNTVQSIVRGIAPWSDQGIFFATEREHHHAVLDEKSDLHSFFGKPIESKDLSQSAFLSMKYHFQRTKYTHSDEGLSHVQDIVLRCEKMGKGYFVVSSSADEECEREMQREIEEEEEEEIEIEKLPPRNEEDWDYSNIFLKEGLSILPTETYRFIDALSKFWSDKDGLRRIKWSDDLFCTRNFIETISTGGRALDAYLRIPDCLVRFQDGQVLLLSDREGAKICEIFLDRQLSGSSCMGLFFGHFAFETDPTSKSCPLRCHSMITRVKSLRDIDSCSMKLFNGETVYPSSQRRVIKDMLSPGLNGSENFAASNITGTPETFIAARQKQKDLELSHLEEICNEIIFELEQID